MTKYVPIRSARTFRRHREAGARFEVNNPLNLSPSADRSEPDTYWTPNGGWITPGGWTSTGGTASSTAGAYRYANNGQMAVRAVYDGPA